MPLPIPAMRSASSIPSSPASCPPQKASWPITAPMTGPAADTRVITTSSTRRMSSKCAANAAFSPSTASRAVPIRERPTAFASRSHSPASRATPLRKPSLSSAACRASVPAVAYSDRNMSRSPETSCVSMGMRDGSMPSSSAYASRPASPMSRIAPPARSSSEAASARPGLLASMALREASSASAEAPVCSAMNFHSANVSTETPSASARAAASASPAAIFVSPANAASAASRRTEANAATCAIEDFSEIPPVSNPSAPSARSPVTAITHVPLLSPPCSGVRFLPAPSGRRS